MTTYDLGDPVALSINIRDAAGALANAGAVVLTVTLPDGTSETPLVTNASTGVKIGHHKSQVITEDPFLATRQHQEATDADSG